MNAHSIAIVGGGIAGLTLAWELGRRGHTVRVYEASERLGGPIHTMRAQGYTCELGPHTLLQRTESLGRFIDELGLRPHMIVAKRESARRLVVRDGRLVAVPQSAAEFVRTPLFSPQAKLRLLAEPIVGRFDADLDESLANFVKRRLGEEVLDYAVDPFVGGTYAGNPRVLSARHAFPVLSKLEQTYGSLARAGVDKVAQKVRSRLGAGGPPPPTDKPVPHTLFSFDGGAGMLIEALAAKVGDAAICGAAVERVSREGGQWRVSYRKSRRLQHKLHDAVIFTAPAHALARIEAIGTGGAPLSMNFLEKVDYPPVTIVTTGVRRQDIDHALDAFGYLIPRVENFHTLGTLFNSSMFPHMAPEGHVSLSTFVGGARQPENALKDDTTLIEFVRMDLRRLIGLRGYPSFVHIERYPTAIPQYEVGYDAILNGLSGIERREPGLYFAGNFRDGIAVPAVIEAARKRAETVSSFLYSQAPKRAAKAVGI